MSSNPMADDRGIVSVWTAVTVASLILFAGFLVGSATAKIAAGLLADSATKVILRQAPDQLDLARSAFGLSEAETEIVRQLVRGRAIWKIAGQTALVDLLMSPQEAVLCDTDARMAGRADTADEAIP